MYLVGVRVGARVTVRVRVSALRVPREGDEVVGEDVRVHLVRARFELRIRVKVKLRVRVRARVRVPDRVRVRVRRREVHEERRLDLGVGLEQIDLVEQRGAQALGLTCVRDRVPGQG